MTFQGARSDSVTVYLWLPSPQNLEGLVDTVKIVIMVLMVLELKSWWDPRLARCKLSWLWLCYTETVSAVRIQYGCAIRSSKSSLCRSLIPQEPKGWLKFACVACIEAVMPWHPRNKVPIEISMRFSGARTLSVFRASAALVCAFRPGLGLTQKILEILLCLVQIKDLT